VDVSEVLTASVIRAIRKLALYSLRLYLHLLSARGLLTALMMETLSTSETSVNFHETKSSNIPEYSHFHVGSFPCI
jgi:hypothetical protein